MHPYDSGVETVVFDLDGTLVDTLPDIHVALCAALAGVGGCTPSLAETRALIGGGARVLVAGALRSRDPGAGIAEIDDRHARFVSAYAARPVRGSHVYDGVVPCLEALDRRGIGLAVCTNKPETLARAVLSGLDLFRFFGDAVVAGDTLAVKKPDAAPLLEAVARAGGDPARAALVGDSAADAGAARAAGIPFVAVSYGYGRTRAAALDADLVIDGFDRLAAALDRIGGEGCTMSAAPRPSPGRRRPEEKDGRGAARDRARDDPRGVDRL